MSTAEGRIQAHLDRLEYHDWLAQRLRTLTHPEFLTYHEQVELLEDEAGWPRLDAQRKALEMVLEHRAHVTTV